MNNRIIELARTADDEVNPFSERYLVDISPNYLTKFAELIIQECVDIFDNISYSCDNLKERINQHFGIENDHSDDYKS